MAQAEEQVGRGAFLPLAVQNAYRERYRAIRPEWRSSGDQLEAMVRSHVTSNSSVLDLGCGRGGVVELFWREAKLAAGLGPDSPSLSGHRAPGMPVIRGVGERLPFIDESFDLIVCLWVLEHLQDPAAMMREVHRVLRPGGHFVFLTPNMRNPLMVANRIGRALPSLQRRLVPRFYGREGGASFPVGTRGTPVGPFAGNGMPPGRGVSAIGGGPDRTNSPVTTSRFRASLMSERLMPKGWGVHLLGDLIRP